MPGQNKHHLLSIEIHFLEANGGLIAFPGGWDKTSLGSDVAAAAAAWQRESSIHGFLLWLSTVTILLKHRRTACIVRPERHCSYYYTHRCCCNSHYTTDSRLCVLQEPALLPPSPLRKAFDRFRFLGEEIGKNPPELIKN